MLWIGDCTAQHKIALEYRHLQQHIESDKLGSLMQNAPGHDDKTFEQTGSRSVAGKAHKPISFSSLDFGVGPSNTSGQELLRESIHARLGHVTHSDADERRKRQLMDLLHVTKDSSAVQAVVQFPEGHHRDYSRRDWKMDSKSYTAAAQLCLSMQWMHVQL